MMNRATGEGTVGTSWSDPEALQRAAEAAPYLRERPAGPASPVTTRVRLAPADSMTTTRLPIGSARWRPVNGQRVVSRVWYAATMIEIGPYRFSQADARATVHHADDLFDLLVDGLPAAGAAIAAPFRARAKAAIDRPLDQALPVCWEELRAAAAALRATGVYGPPAHGNVVQLNTSRGGVPKTPVDQLDVNFRGVAGDVQAHRQHHGRPWQALCLWSADVIDDFARASHPIRPGAAGENVTVTGVDWARVRPGVVLNVGTVQCEVVAFALPCAQNARWFLDGDFNQMHHRNGPVSRVYALITCPGTIATQDELVVMPGEPASH
jgi:MOSC domain-containing protein YiiM